MGIEWNLTQIRTLVRDITGTPDTDQLTNDEIDLFINTYYTFEMPFELKEQINLQPLNFFALPNIDVYNFPGAFLTDQPMAYADGFPLIFYQDRDIFFQDWPQQYASDQIGAGNGVTTAFAGSTQNFPIIRGTFLATDGTQVVFDQSNGILYQTVIGINVPVGNINYVTGQFAFVFQAPPANGTTIYDKYQGYQPARPQGVLFYNNVFTFRPIPDQTYQITMQGYINQQQLIFGNDSPLQTEWGQLIGYGAAIQIFSRRGDLGQVNTYYPLLKRYENIALARYVQQLESAQSVPRF